MIITSLLDTDFYKFTMGQFAWKYYPDVKVKYAFTDRTKYDCTLDKLSNTVLVHEIVDELDAVRNLKFTMEELNYLNDLGIFSKDYINFLGNLNLPPVYVTLKDKQLVIETEGKWSEAIFWETFILSIVNELYYKSYGKTPAGYWGNFDDNLKGKISKIRKNPFKIVEFGTRRRFSKNVQDMLVDGLSSALYDEKCFAGTSNVFLAKQYGLKPIGTMAHELPMVLAGLANVEADVRDSHSRMLKLWYALYGEELSIALTDTFGSDFFFKDFTKEQAREWKGLRQDSGDPIEFLYNACRFYDKAGIRTEEKVIVFSDGLNINKILEIEKEARKNKINAVYGWGTNLTNDVGAKPLSIVVKAVEADGKPLVKLSDNLNKAIGNKQTIENYKKIFGYTNTNKSVLKY